MSPKWASGPVRPKHHGPRAYLGQTHKPNSLPATIFKHNRRADNHHCGLVISCSLPLLVFNTMDRDRYEAPQCRDEQSISTELRSTASAVTPILQLFHFHRFNSFKKRKNVSLHVCLSSTPLYILQTPSDRERINSSLSTSLLLSLALGFPSLRFFDLGLQFLFFAYAFDFFS